MHLAASVRIVGPGPSGNRPLDPVLQRRAATSVVGLCGTPSTSIISGVGCAETRGSLHLLDNFQGILQADGYSGYGQVCRENGLTRIGCWDHARRKFVDASRAAPAKGKKGQPSKADVALSHIRKLYAVEKAGNQLSDGERYRLRQEKSLPLLNAFKAWLEKNASKVLKGSLTRKAMDYTLNQWDTVVGYCERGDLKISNAGAENAIRPFALGRNQGVSTHGWVQLMQDYNPQAEVALLHRGLTWPE